jgi:hypothetical protein
VSGYERFLAIMADPEDPEHDETRIWCGGHSIRSGSIWHSPKRMSGMLSSPASGAAFTNPNRREKAGHHSWR